MITPQTAAAAPVFAAVPANFCPSLGFVTPSKFQPHKRVPAQLNGITPVPSTTYGITSAPQRAQSVDDMPMGVEGLLQATPHARQAANRLAREELLKAEPDPDVLRLFSGSGGLGQSIDEFFTPQAVAEAMVSAAGYWGGYERVLDPACGIGNLLCRTPVGTRRVGLELNEVSAQIAQKLLKDASIHATTGERYFTTSADPLFDVALVNPPFGPRFLRHQDKPEISRNEHYFTQRTMEWIKHGGGVAVFLLPLALTSGASHQAWREDIAARGQIVSHLLIPNGAFQDAGAGVTTVILSVVRHDVGVYEALMTLTREQQAQVLAENGSFIKGSLVIRQATDYRTKQVSTVVNENTMILSDNAKLGTGRYGEPSLPGRVTFSDEQRDFVSEAVSRGKTNGSLTLTQVLGRIHAVFGEEAATTARAASKAAPLHPLPTGTTSPDGRFVMTLHGWEPSQDFAKAEVSEAMQVGLTLSRAKEADADGKPSWALWRTAAAQDASYRQKHGAYNLKLLRPLSARFGVLALLLAHLTESGLEISRAQRRLPRISGTPEQIAAELADLQALTEEELMDQSGLSQAQAEALLAGQYCFTGDLWQHPEMYYVGNAVLRSEHARTYSASFSGVRRSALMRQSEEFLKLMTPATLDQVRISPRDPVVPLAAMDEFVNVFLGTVNSSGQRLISVDREGGAIKFHLVYRGQHHRGSGPNQMVNEVAAKNLLAYLNHNTRMATIKDASLMDAEEYQAERAVAMEEARAYEDQVLLAFNTWLSGSAHADTVLEAYNRAHRAHIAPKGMTQPLQISDWKGPSLHPYQNAAVRRMVTTTGSINGDDVGLGKTYICLMLIAYLKHVGQAVRPVVVVPAGLVGNWASSAARALPSWNVVVVGMTPKTNKQGYPEYKTLRSGAVMVDESGNPILKWKDDSTAVRRQKLAALSAGKADLVIMSRDMFTALPMSEQNRERLIREDLQARTRIESSEGFDMGGRRYRHDTLSRIQKFQGACNARLKAAQEGDLLFEHLGVDLLCFDEAHSYKNRFASPNAYGTTPKFLGGGAESNRALDAGHKARYVRMHGGRTYAFTASWLKNSPIEIASMVSLVSDDLPLYGLNTVEDLMEHFIQIEPRIITTLEGDVKVLPAVVGFRRMIELKQLIDSMVLARRAGQPGVVKADGTPLHVPTIREIEHTISMSAEQQTLYKELRDQATKAKNRTGGPKTTNKAGKETDPLHLFSVMSRMRKLTSDPVLLGINGPNPRFDAIAEQALRVRAAGGKSLVFLSIGESEGSFDRLKATLIRAGYPAHEIEIVTGKTHKNSVERADLEDNYNHGDLTLILGSEVLSEGFNLQRGTRAIIHGDIPWNFEGIRQRNGRGGRQGNTVAEVESIFILMRGSFDMITYTIMRGKRAWQLSLDGTTDETSNTAAEIGLEELALMLSEDPEATRLSIQNKKDELHQISAAVVTKRKLQQVMQTHMIRTLLKKKIEEANARKNGWTRFDYLRVAQFKQALSRALLKTESPEQFPLAALVHYTGHLDWQQGIPLHKGMTLTFEEQRYEIYEITKNDVKVTLLGGGGRSSVRALTFREVSRYATDHLPTEAARLYDTESVLKGVRLVQVVLPDNAPLNAVNGSKVNPRPRAANVLSVSVKGDAVETVPSQNQALLLRRLQEGNTVIHYLTRDDVEGLIIEQVVILCADAARLKATQDTLANKKAQLQERLRSIAVHALAS